MVKALTVGEQVKEALDGRPVKWLVFKVFIHELDLRQKIKGTKEFTDDELERVNKVLNVNIKK